MRSQHSDWRTWFRASLFPFKLYTVAVVIGLFYWYGSLPAKPIRRGFEVALGMRRDYAAELAYSDFGYMTTWAVYGYFVCAGVLIIGGLVQAFTSSRRTAIFSFAFGIAAAVIGWLLIPYCWRGQQAAL